MWCRETGCGFESRALRFRSKSRRFYATRDWDGYGAIAVAQETLHNAFLFLESLPFGFPAPSIGAEPDGHLTLEWHRGRRRTLSVSVSPEGELHYAGLFGPSRVNGTEALFGEVPGSILDLIRRVYWT